MIKILLVEDDPLMARLYEKAFRFSGYGVEIVFNGKEALKKLSVTEQQPTLILLDIMMPEMNGLETLQKLKQNSKTRNVPVVVLTNLAGQEDAEKALSLGAVIYLIKSQYEPKEIVEKVKEIVGGYAGRKIPEVKVVIKDTNTEKKIKKVGA